MMQQIETMRAAARANARMVAQDAVTYSQAAALKLAEGVAVAKRPATALFDAGLKLNQIAYGAAADLLETQKDAVLGAVDGGVQRLRTAADAESLRALWEGQVALYPAGLERMKKDLDRTVETLKGAGMGVKTLAAETREAIYGEKPAAAEAAKAAPAPRKKAAARTAKKAARKVTKKATKKAARKVAKPVADQA